MKKAALLLLVLLVCCGCACGLAQEADPGLLSALTAAGVTQTEQLQTWGDTAACIAQLDGQKALCLLERRDGQWQVTVCNPKALRQDLEAPRLWLDSDQAVFWSYQAADAGIDFHCGRETGAEWGPVDETWIEPLGERLRVYQIGWQAEHGGEIAWQERLEDENENLIVEKQPQALPASWLKDCVALADFDVERFPVMASPADDYALWPGQAFFAEAAACLMPEYTFIKGVLRQGEMHFLMQKPSGEKVYVVCDTTFNAHEVNLIESTPLPQDAVLGVENFTDCLGWAPERMVSIRNMPNAPWCSLAMSWGFGAEGAIRFGSDCVFADENEIYVGSHPWRDITGMDWSSVPTSLADATARMDAGSLNLCYAAVNNPNPADRLHLREKPDRGSRSLGKYYSGTPVKVWEIRGGWAQVEIGGQSGFMMTKYLTMGKAGQALRCDTSAMPQLLLRGEQLPLYAWPEGEPCSVSYGEAVMKVIGIIGTDWYHVWFPETGEFFFVRQGDLWEGNG